MIRLTSCLLVSLLLVSLLLVSEAIPQSPQQRTPPNILFIAVDDLRTELGCYGLPYVQSPHLDRLASQGVLFTNHFVQVPTCGASRYALLTGKSPGRSGAMGNQSMYAGRTMLSQQSLRVAQTFPEAFRINGYRTVCIGKISHTPDGRIFAYDGSGDGRHEVPNAWDELATPFGAWRRGWGTFFAYHGGRHREDGQGHRDLMEFVADRDDELPDGMMARAAISKLADLKARREETGQPFLMGLGFYKPHLPFVATKSDWDAFDGVAIPPPPSPAKHASSYWHRSGEFYKYDMPFEKTRPLAAADQIAARRAYLACVRYVDRQIGKVLKSLDELELTDSTIVVVWGDHGWHLGDTAIWGKHSPFDRALHSTLMIRAPGATRAGLQCHELVETTDLYPTLMDLCESNFRRVSRPGDGQSLRPLLRGETKTLHRAAISYWAGGVTVRTKTHRLIAKTSRFHGNPDKRDNELSNIELYDLSSSVDPANEIGAANSSLVEELVKLIPVFR